MKRGRVLLSQEDEFLSGCRLDDLVEGAGLVRSHVENLTGRHRGRPRASDRKHVGIGGSGLHREGDGNGGEHGALLPHRDTMRDMEASLAERFEALEKRRIAMVERVRALPIEKRDAKQGSAFSAGEVIE